MKTGKYEVLHRLGAGGMGEVFLAREMGVAGLDRLVVLKTLLPTLAVQSEHIVQFLDEARVAARLNHPNIVAIYDVYQQDGQYVIAMEYVPGVSVAELMGAVVSRSSRVPSSIAARITLDVARALDYAHAAVDDYGSPLGIVHRDISPQNLMVRRDGVTKVVDFGVAKAANRFSRTSTGVVKGKISYMPPEQASGEPVDGRADQFSLGVVFWEMCSGQRLWNFDSPLRAVLAVTQELAPTLRSRGVQIEPELEEVVMRMLAREPEERFPTCGDVARALEPIVAREGADEASASTAAFLRDTVGATIEAKSAEVARAAAAIDEGETVELSPSRKRNVDDVAAEYTPLRVTTPAPGRRGRRLVLASVVGASIAAATLYATSWSGPQSPVLAPGPESPAFVEELATMQITSSPSGASLRFDGAARGTTPVTVEDVTPDIEHRVELELAGHDPVAAVVVVRKGERAVREFELQKTPSRVRSSRRSRGRNAARPRESAVESTGHGFLTITTEPWSRVTIDGQPYGSTPVYRVELSRGQHTVRLDNDDEGIHVTRKVQIRPAEVVKWKLNLTQPEP